MCNPGSLKRVIRIFLFVCTYSRFHFFATNLVFIYQKVSKKENLNSSSSFMNNRVSA